MSAPKKPRYEELYSISGERAVCKQPGCTASYAWGHRHGTKHPLEHYREKHPTELEKHYENHEPNQQGILSFFGKKNEDLSQREKYALAICIGQHPLPFSFFEDPVMQWAFGFKLSAKTVKNDVKKLYEKVLVGVKEYISGKKGTLAIDGWKNPVTKEKHLCIVVQPISSERKTFFISSTVIRGTIDSDVIYHFLIESITELQAMDFTTVAVVGDNAPSQQAAFVKLAEEYPSICPLRCGAHVMNLVIKNIIKSACADGLGIVEKFVSEGKVKRYVETRWNSLFDKLGEILRGPFLIAPQEKNDLEKSQKLIQPVIDVLNYSQKNDAIWDVFINKYKKLMTDQTLPRVTVDSLKKYEKYLVNCITEILNAIENASEISEKTSDWLRSFSIDRLTDIETAAMMHSIDIDKKTSENLLKFKRIVLSKFSVSEAEVERVFARHKAVHTNMRARLQNELVEQMLFIRYNAFVCKMVPTAFDDLYDDEENESFEAIEDYE